MTAAFFEGPEKKVELAVRTGVDLRGLSRSFWEEVVRSAGAEIVSVINTAELDAYLLSESSLFVFRERVVMITCGRTRLVDAVLLLIDHFGPSAVESLIYERKNEHFPERQRTSFYDDAARIAERVPGQALQFGDEDGHRIQVFYGGTFDNIRPDDTTLEVLMHGIDEECARAFVGGRVPEGGLAVHLGLDLVLPGFALDEFMFEPAGYSLNAVRGSAYWTVHVTPESLGSYVSFETNWDFRSDLTGLVGRVVECFRPDSFDVFAFVPGRDELDVELPGFALRRRVDDIVGGYRVLFKHMFRLDAVVSRARPVEFS